MVRVWVMVQRLSATTAMAPIGSNLVIIAIMVQMKIANKCHALLVKPSGAGVAHKIKPKVKTNRVGFSLAPSQLRLRVVLSIVVVLLAFKDIPFFSD